VTHFVDLSHNHLATLVVSTIHSDCHVTMRTGEGMQSKASNLQGRTQVGFGVKPPWAWYFTKTLLPAQKKLDVFAYFLLVNLSTLQPWNEFACEFQGAL